MFSQANVESIIRNCEESAGALAESLNLCFDSSYRLEMGESDIWRPDSVPPEIEGAGLVVAFEAGGQGMLCLVPQSLPLPDWYTQPGESEESRLQTLAMEWAQLLFSDEPEPPRFASIAVDNLHSALNEAEPNAWAAMFELLVTNEANDQPETSVTSAEDADTAPNAQADGDSDSTEESQPSEDGPPIADDDADTSAETENAAETAEPGPSAESPAPVKIYVVCPVDNPPFEISDAEAEPESAEASRAQNRSDVADDCGTRRPTSSAALSSRYKLLQKLPVTVIVRLAEKKIELGQLLSLTPGALVTFNKSCEDLLDLYVNNQIYCRGEAIKIGEKFGLKITSIGHSVPSHERVFEI